MEGLTEVTEEPLAFHWPLMKQPMLVEPKPISFKNSKLLLWSEPILLKPKLMVMMMIKLMKQELVLVIYECKNESSCVVFIKLIGL